MQQDNQNKNLSKQIGRVLLLVALAFAIYYIYFKYFHQGGSYQ